MNEWFSLRAGLRGVFHALRLRGPLAGDPTARVLHAFLLSLLCWHMAWSAILSSHPMPPARLGALFIQHLLPIGSLVLLRLGFLRRASLFYLVGATIFATYQVAFNGGIRSPLLAHYVTVPIMASWLLGFGGALWTLIACMSSLLVFALIELAGIDLPRPYATPLGLWAVHLQIAMTGSLPVALMLKKLNKALDELERHGQRLESIVDQRTSELVQARDKAESANRAKSVFLANMSHELRTPLSVILASSNLLSESNPTADQAEDIGRIGRSGEHLLGLIDDVLDVAKIEAGKQELAMAPSDLISTVRTVVEMMRGRAEEKHLALAYRQTPKVPRYVRVDAPKLRQILINLLGNAIKFTPEGTVTLQLSAQPGDEPGRPRLCFEIEDSGVGVPQHDLGRIFEPFEQVRNSGPQKGTGLGLTITRRFVELMGGTLLVESEVGRGSRFVVELPLELARESETYGGGLAPGHPFILESGQPDWRVLIVEDDPENATVLRKMLTRSGFLVMVAENGALGIEAFQQWRPHFIWMDLGLPRLTGTEAAQRIRRLDGGTDVKIAALTASAFPSEREGVIRAGFDDLAFKPFRPTEIFFCMARHLGVRYSPPEEAGNASRRQVGGRPA